MDKGEQLEVTETNWGQLGAYSLGQGWDPGVPGVPPSHNTNRLANNKKV